MRPGMERKEEEGCREGQLVRHGRFLAGSPPCVALRRLAPPFPLRHLLSSAGRETGSGEKREGGLGAWVARWQIRVWGRHRVEHVARTTTAPGSAVEVEEPPLPPTKHGVHETAWAPGRAAASRPRHEEEHGIARTVADSAGGM
ncbi:hypothetical protein E2562_002790 [Oryza meyeriana var. granulata]|uniref:Uncharacterized protein n=1 Tax=Oryza meyeriana var. granulata TaxID=110450 RepID=A0A6G1BPW6_9ORYZ|nr:hypothetical protein E2562_002790 [Oryza meyeriana var. granulata]